ncbi:MAG TPA: GAF domain-containing protein [Myxococcales bacterium]|jgi:nitrate/nitrite-specific signal transduction histidine kinase|nr:GAF domain-containing protein [Myxococcales bacterium]
MAAPGQLPPRLGSALDELRATLDRAAELAKEIEGAKPQLVHAPSDLSARLADVESDREELSNKLAEYEQQVGRLMNLYVATYQLHATLDPGEVQATIAEIAINLLGAEKFVLLFWKNDDKEKSSGECEIALSQGLEDDKSGLYTNGVYTGGDPAVDATLADGVLRIGPLDGSEALACVPLTVQGATVGALVILSLFQHKDALRPEDRDLLDLIAAHAASALFAARVYSNTDRKLKTLESLVALVRRQ